MLMHYGIVNYTFRKYEMLYESNTDFIFMVIIKTCWIMLRIVYLNLFCTLGGKLWLLIFSCWLQLSSFCYVIDKHTHNLLFILWIVCIVYRNEKERQQPAILLQDSRDCGILSCRPLFLQRFAGIKVSVHRIMQIVYNGTKNMRL
jgi:hypothetical protein